MRDNKEGFNRRGRILKPYSCDQIQPDWKEKKVPKSSEKEAFCA